MQRASWVFLVCLWVSSCISTAVQQRFVVDLEARTIAVRHEGVLVRLVGVEPILGRDDGDFGLSEVRNYLAGIPADERLRVVLEERRGRPAAAVVYRAAGGTLNADLLSAGLARAVTHEHYGALGWFVHLETEARLKGTGLWRIFQPREEAAVRPPEGLHQVYRIFYATDRALTSSAKPNEVFGPERGLGLRYGTCEVSIPRDHKMGELERPSKWRLEFREDPDKHVVLLRVVQEEKDGFFTGLSQQVGQSTDRAALVFVHGFNVEFAEAARRTAQLAYDLGFNGAPILYSWPSRGSLTDYGADAATADWSSEHLRQFLQDVALRSGARTVHLIAHSMGNRVLTQALRGVKPLQADGTPLRFNQVVLTAPDIDAQMFREQVVPAIRGCAERITLYASSEDEALKASKKLHHFPRAGDSGAEIVVVEGIDSIDVSALDTSFMGHSYFGDNRSVITDLMALLQEHKSPAQRRWLLGVPPTAPKYWAFKP